MGLYSRNILPRVIDFACRQRHVSAPRQSVVPRARGKTLEVGFGTGLNLPYYDAGRVSGLWALDPAWEAMAPLARQRLAASTIPLIPLPASADAIPATDAYFDSVVVTYSLCSIADPASALAEIMRVLKPGGNLLFAEHGLAPDPAVRRLQGLLNPCWGYFGGGCQLDRPIDRLILNSGFGLQGMEQGYLPGLRFASYVYRGVAIRP